MSHNPTRRQIMQREITLQRDEEARLARDGMPIHVLC